MMKIYRHTADSNDDFIQIENESANEDVVFEKELRWFEVQKECD